MARAKPSAVVMAKPQIPAGRRGDTSEEVYVRLRDLIVEGVYAPGRRLPHARLMESLNVGRTPLRTALSRLQSDGLVIATPNRGVEVAQAPISSAEEIYAIRFLVEPPLLEASVPTISQEQVALMRHWLGRMERAVEDPEAFAVAHREFHIVERAAFTTPFIDGLVVDMYRHLHRHHRTRIARSYAPKDFLHLDRMTVDAVATGDALRARRLLEFHLVDAAISFLGEADENHHPAKLLAVAATNGLEIETSADGAVPRPARARWTTPCATLGKLRTPYLVHKPEVS
jgi:DNA-binding GntR family transcriptional regulator